ncbi:MAG: hypothetical protein M0R38_11390 [Bacteroidia bacterium]|nr:hypothetical protein [Bacteroidia bacterium]
MKNFNRTYTLKMEEEDGSSREIIKKTTNMEGLSFDELLGSFKQFLLMLGYTELTVKTIVCLSLEELEELGIKEEDLSIYNW